MNGVVVSKKYLLSMKLLFSVAALLLWVLFASAAVTAQSDEILLSGSVADQNGAAVSDARVTLRLTNTEFERTTVTDATGDFSFDDLAPGQYQLRATSTGFSIASLELALRRSERRSVDLILQPGSITADVLVSATRIAGTPEVVERIPGSVEIVDRKTLEVSRPFTSSEALRKVTGVNVRDEEGFGLRPNVGIRGLNPTRSTKVLLLEDGVPLTYAPYGDNASYYHPPIDRFETIEVLKGSGQITYGPTTVGGVINYITRTPPDEPSGFITLIGGSRDYFNGHINYGGTWGGTGLLFDYTRKQGEGSRDNIRIGLNDFNFKSVSALGAKQALTFKFNYFGEDSNVPYSGLTEAEFSADPRQNSFRNDFFYGDRYGASVTHALVFNSAAVLTTNFYGAHFRRHWWRQSSNSGQRPSRLSTGSNPDPDCRSMADLDTTCGNEGRLRSYYFVGVEPRLHVTHRLLGTRSEADFGLRAHFETQERRQENGPAPTSRSGLLSENNERRNQAYSGFAQNRFSFGEWSVTPGIRIEHIGFERTNRILGVRGRTDLTQVIPGLGLSYHPSEKISVFAGAHRGFAPPRTEDIINNTTGGTVELDSELSWNYEIGVRSAPRPGVRMEATIFRLDYENQIVPASLAGGVGATLTNGGETLHQGVEIVGRIDTGALLKKRHNFYLRTAYTYIPIAEFEGTRLSNVSGFSSVSVSGNRLPYAPQHLLNTNVGYSHPSGIDTLIEAVYVGRQFSDDLNTITPTPNGQRGLIPSYVVWNATANHNIERLRLTVFMTVKNLFDRTYIVDRSRGILPSSPRLVQAGLKFRF